MFPTGSSNIALFVHISNNFVSGQNTFAYSVQSSISNVASERIFNAPHF